MYEYSLMNCKYETNHFFSLFYGKSETHMQ